MTQEEKLQHLNEDKRLIYYIALKYYRRYGLEKDDAIQYCYIGYWTGLDAWNPDKGSLSSFMCVRMKQRLDEAVKKERRHRKKYKIVNESDMTNDFVFTNIKDESPTPEEAYIQNVWSKEVVEKAMHVFSERDKELLRRYYTNEEDTLPALAKEYNVSTQRISQINMRFKKIIRRLEGYDV